VRLFPSSTLGDTSGRPAPSWTCGDPHEIRGRWPSFVCRTERKLKSTQNALNRLVRTMTAEELARKTAVINFEIIVTHGLSDGGVGFEWHGLFIHDPFTDPQYGAFPVDPTQQYGDAYLNSILATDPAKALSMAQRELREKASVDLSRYCVEHGLDAAAVIETVCGVRVQKSDKVFGALADEQVEAVWAHVDGGQR